MNKNKKGTILIIVILIIILAGIAIYLTNRKNDTKNETNNINNEEHQDEEGLTGLIDNEEYYYSKQKEYNEISGEYEDLVSQYASEKFTEEQKNVIKDYNKKMIAAEDKETKKKLSDEYVKIYNKYMQQQFSEEQLKSLDEKRKQMEELEPIVDEYQELIAKAQEEKSKEGLQTLEDGNIQSNRSGITGEKEYNGLKFSNIKLIYNPTKKETTISMKVENITDETKGNELVTLNFTGNTECKYPIKIEEISAREYLEIQFSIGANLTDTDNLEIIKFDESDYTRNDGNDR